MQSESWPDAGARSGKMGIGGTDDAEHVRVHARRLLVLQAGRQHAAKEIVLRDASDIQSAATAGLTLFANRGPVELKGSAYLDWSLGPWGANLTINHASSYENINPGVLRTDVDGYTTVDLQGSYVLPESGWRITAGVQNVFDEDFPFFDSHTGVNSAHVDSRRRVAFVDISREFSW